MAHSYGAQGTPVGDAFKQFSNDLADALDKCTGEQPTSAGPAVQEPPLTDDSPMPFGKHRGTPLKAVPRDYFIWLCKQPDPVRHAALRTWLIAKSYMKPASQATAEQPLPF